MMSIFDIDKAVEELEAISADFETDEATREDANKQIKVLRSKKQDVLFGNVAARTGALQECVSALESVSRNAKVGGLGERIKSLTSLTAQGNAMLGELKRLKGP